MKKNIIVAAVLGLIFICALSCQPKRGAKPAEPQTAKEESSPTAAELPAAVAEVVQLG